MKYTVELIWNREFNYCHWKDFDDLEKAKREVDSLVNMGDGASVKKARVIDNETNETVYYR